MKLTRTWALMMISVVALAGCRGSDGGGGEEGEVSAPGVTSEPCPEAVNEDNGCIYLGQISDLTVGPFAPLGVAITDAAEAFWTRVNEDGGIGGYDVDVTKYIRDNKYVPETHNEVYQAIKGDVLALAQTLGSPTTAAIIGDLNTQQIVAAPASWTSAWEFEDVIVESSTNYCFEAMNAVDYRVSDYDAQSVMSVGYEGDYGGDGAAGAEIAAGENGLDYENVEIVANQEGQPTAVSAILKNKPDLVVLATGPTDTAVIVGESAARGYQGRFIGLGPTWNQALVDSPAAEALKGLYNASGYNGPWESDTTGHQAMRDALGDVEPTEGYTVGWVWQYPLKAALETWADGDDLTREGLLTAVQSLETVDYEGMLPEEAGNFSGEGNETVYRGSLISEVDDTAATGLSVVRDFTVGPTAEAYEFTESCYQP